MASYGGVYNDTTLKYKPEITLKIKILYKVSTVIYLLPVFPPSIIKILP